VPSAEVRLSRWNDGSALSAAPARADILLRTDEHGRWTTRQLAPGRWQLFIRVLGYAPHNAGLDVKGGANDTVVTALRQTVANLQSIVVTAANREQLLKDVVVTTEVLSAKQIRESGASSLSGVLAQHSGLS